MATSLIYQERTTGDQSPMSFGCSMESGRASGTYLLSGVADSTDLTDAIQDLIGDVQYEAGAGGLTRTLPRAHPFLPWYVAGISSFRGVGGCYTPITLTTSPLDPSITQYCLYDQYEINVDFQPRPYPVFDDGYIQSTSSSWVQQDGSSQDYTFFNEWERFTTMDITPSPDSVTVQLGQLCFNATGLPNGAKPFTALPKMFLNNEVLKFTWNQVPLRYYTSTNSYLRRFRGCVNQNTWTTTSFGTYQPGEILYLGCSLKPYTPPTASDDVIAQQGLTVFPRFVNIEVNCLYTKRTLGTSPLEPPTNDYWVVGGHNLNPYFGSASDTLSRTFLYTCTTNPGSGFSEDSQALWPSCPFELIFSDPDSPGAI